MDAPAVTGGFDGGAGGVDVVGGAAGQTGDDRAAHLGGDLLDRVEIAVADDRETGLDDIDVEASKLAGDLHFFAQVHGSAGALFAVAQGGVENDDFVGHEKIGMRGCGVRKRRPERRQRLRKGSPVGQASHE